MNRLEYLELVRKDIREMKPSYYQALALTSLNKAISMHKLNRPYILPMYYLYASMDDPIKFINQQNNLIKLLEKRN